MIFNDHFNLWYLYIIKYYAVKCILERFFVKNDCVPTLCIYYENMRNVYIRLETIVLQ